MSEVQKKESEIIEEQLEKLSSDSDNNVVRPEEVIEPPKEEKVTPEPVPKKEDKPVEPKVEDNDSSKEPIKEQDVKADNSAFARMRIKEEKLAGEIDKLRQELESVKTKPPVQEVTDKKEVKQETQRPSLDVVLNHLVRAKSGDLTDAELNAMGNIAPDAVAKQLMEVVSEDYGSEELLEIQKKAIRGDFGEQSANILSEVNTYMPMVMARERQDEKKQSAEHQNNEKILQNIQVTYKTELEKVVNDFPDLASGNPLVEKAIESWEKEFIGEFDGLVLKKEGKLPKDLSQYLLLHPYERARFISTAIGASSSAQSELNNAKEEIKKLKGKLHLSESPESGSPSVIETGKKLNTSKEIEEELERISRSYGS